MDFKPHHYAIVSSDLSLTLQFYRLFGFEEKLTWVSPDGDLTIVHAEMGGIFLEVFAPKVPIPAPSAMASLSTDLQAIGTKHFGLKVQSIEAAAGWVAETFDCDPPKVITGRTSIRYFFVKDPDGNWLEIVQDDRKF